MSSLEKQSHLDVGQIIILIVGFVLFVWGTHDWFYTEGTQSILWLYPIGVMLLGVLLLVMGGYAYPAIQAAAGSQAATFGSAILAIVVLLIASMFINGITTPGDGLEIRDDDPDSDPLDNETLPTNLNYTLVGELNVDDAWGSEANVTVYSDFARTDLIDEWKIDDDTTVTGPFVYNEGDVVYLWSFTDEGVTTEVHELTVGTPGPFLGKWVISFFDPTNAVRGVIYISWTEV